MKNHNVKKKIKLAALLSVLSFMSGDVQKKDSLAAASKISHKRIFAILFFTLNRYVFSAVRALACGCCPVSCLIIICRKIYFFVVF